ncbi:uncharacterized protein LOC127851478 [Dreissena polymorpha]|uniref:uncharacterized protein LOC127851478 n=1 Tax=Dreissena polymorpha TaxID=45954 RepID=UPI002263F894|nr:uncharacterized protein LOC127851478 [Dreissena polymorpha]
MCVLKVCAFAALQNGFVNAAFSWGDPVIQTVGSPSYAYSFNGHGEYVFLKSENGLEIQARLDYLVHEITDSTIFTAFTFTNHHVNETVQIEFDRASKHISLFLNNGTLWKTSPNCTIGPPIRTFGFMLVCLRPPVDGFHIAPIMSLNNILLDVMTDGEFMNIKVLAHPPLMNTTGLAGNVHDSFYVSKNATKFPVNTTEDDMFDYGESWYLRTQPNLSQFNYNLTGGNFSYFNAFSKPRFLQHLLNNTTALFEKCNVTNVEEMTGV